MKQLTIAFLFLASFTLTAQRGKDGVGNITVAGTIVNAYTSLTANASVGNNTITVASSSGLNPGDLVFIIQMQGARVNAGKDTIYPDVSSSIPTNTTFGDITNYYNTGNNEFAEVSAVPNGVSIVLDCGLQKDYTASGNVQVVKVPRYTTLTVSGTGYITAPNWNGSTGGVAIVEVQNNTVLSSTPSFSLVGKGFRGGGVEDATTFGGNKFGSINPMQGGYKGESISGDTTHYKNFAGVFCRGAVANGGGGGDAHNAGGGGGANGGVVASYDGYGNTAAGYTAAWNLESAGFATHTSSGGGRGGYTFSSSNQNVTTKAPGNAAWGGDNRSNVGGYGGRPLDYSTGRLFLGGGGGTGDSNDGYAVPGGNGGGLVYILCYGGISGAGTILADGAVALNTNNAGLGCTGKDGASGGGGGGTIILNAAGAISLTAATALSAKGGKGGNQNFGAGCGSTEAYGPGGGGGGGYIATSGALPANSVTGGANGIVSGNASNIASNFPPNGATSGGNGSIGAVSVFTLTVNSPTICSGQPAVLTASSSNGAATINWYNAAAGGSIIATGNTYTTPTYTAAGTYTVYAGSCPGSYRLPATITVNTGLNIVVNSLTICPGQTATLTASGATSYTWNPGGATTSSITASPASTTVYTISGISGTCSGTQTATVTVSPQPTVTVASVTVCSGSSATLTASGASAYTWTPGGQTTASIVVTPTTNTTYSITGSNGSCTGSTTAVVSITPTPTISVASVTICPAQTATLTASGATSYTWNPGGATGSTFTVTPVISSTYTVIGSTSSCTAQATASVTIGPGISITVNSPTICAGQTATLTASGATNYTWTPGGATTPSITASPLSTSVYTVNGTSGACMGTQTATITVVPQPTVTVSNTVICSGTSATLTASGATSYTWNPGGQTTASIVVSPSTTTTYSITGMSGICTSSTTATVSVTPTPTISAASVTICPAQTATLTASGATSYTWNPGGATGSTFTVAPAGNSTYTVIGSTSSCTAQATASVTIGSGISISVNSPTICSGQTTTLTASGATSYTWAPGGANTASISVSPLATAVYTINGTSGACSGMQTATVTVVAQPTIGVSNTVICSGTSATLTASGATSYTWNPGGQTTNSIVVSPSATTAYSVTGMSAICSSSAIATVSVTATPTLSAISATICPGQTATLTASGATSYTWNPGGATGSSFTVAPASSSTYTVIGSTASCSAQATASVTIGSSISISVNSATICAGQSATLTAIGAATYTWTGLGVNTSSVQVAPSTTTVYTVTGSSGTCNGSGTSTVTVKSLPAVAVNSASICSGQTATLTASGATSYAWSDGSSASTQTFSPASTTVYTVTGQTNGCAASVSSTVTVNATPTLSVNSATICAGQAATLTASGATSYTWSTGQNTPVISVSPATATIYTITGANGTCVKTATSQVQVNPSPSITASVSNNTGCAILCAIFSASNSAACATLTINYGDGSTGTSLSHCYNAAGSYTASAICTSTNGCSSSYIIPTPVSVLSSPVASFNVEGGNVVTTGSTIQLNNTSTNATVYHWNLCNNAVSTVTAPSQVAADTGSCCIYLVAETASGCKDTAVQCIQVVNEAVVIIPNVFTPNGDNVNELFKFNSSGLKDLHVTVYDRWGLKMYEWTGVNGSWDGKTKSGASAPSGTYFYIYDYTDLKDKTTSGKGFLSLLKE